MICCLYVGRKKLLFFFCNLDFKKKCLYCYVPLQIWATSRIDRPEVLLLNFFKAVVYIILWRMGTYVCLYIPILPFQVYRLFSFPVFEPGISEFVWGGGSLPPFHVNFEFVLYLPSRARPALRLEGSLWVTLFNVIGLGKKTGYVSSLFAWYLFVAQEHQSPIYLQLPYITSTKCFASLLQPLRFIGTNLERPCCRKGCANEIVGGG